MWNHKNRAYLSLHSSQWPTINLRYEDLVADPEACIHQIALFKEIERKHEFFLSREASTTKYDPEKSYSFYKDYYLKEMWRIQLSNTHIEIINKYLDDRLMAHFGYSQLGLIPNCSQSDLSA